MKVILIEWNAYGNEYMYKTMVSRGYDVLKVPYDSHLAGVDRDSQLDALTDAIVSFKPDYVFSYHYFPNISNTCKETHIPYISWIYDSPAFDIYSPTVLNSVNRIFVFDRGVYDEFRAGGIPTIHHLPLGVYISDKAYSDTNSGSYSMSDMGIPHSTDTSYKDVQYLCDISFVGSLYTEPKHRLYDRFKDIPAYAHGYLDACIEAQKHLYGANILESMITPEIEAEMQKAYPTDPNSTNAMTPAKLYSQFVLSRQVTALERHEILDMLGQKMASEYQYNIRLYTHDRSVDIPGIRNMGPVEYGADMYRIFASSKINLNITLRSILTGIPLRAFDIMNAGGFFLSNYQEELCEYFVPGEDFDYYEDYEDLMNKIEYYLTHEKERCEMAVSAQKKVRSEHSLNSRLDTMENYL